MSWIQGPQNQNDFNSRNTFVNRGFDTPQGRKPHHDYIPQTGPSHRIFNGPPSYDPGNVDINRVLPVKIEKENYDYNEEPRYDPNMGANAAQVPNLNTVPTINQNESRQNVIETGYGNMNPSPQDTQSRIPNNNLRYKNDILNDDIEEELNIISEDDDQELNDNTKPGSYQTSQ